MSITSYQKPVLPEKLEREIRVTDADTLTALFELCYGAARYAPWNRGGRFCTGNNAYVDDAVIRKLKGYLQHDPLPNKEIMIGSGRRYLRFEKTAGNRWLICDKY